MDKFRKKLSLSITEAFCVDTNIDVQREHTRMSGTQAAEITVFFDR
jgi:hypothetical protein